MHTFTFHFECEDQNDRSLTTFPYGQTIIEKDSLEDAVKWFIEYHYPQFDRFVGDNGSWRLKLIRCFDEAENDLTSNALNLLE